MKTIHIDSEGNKKDIELLWKVDTVALLREIVEANPQAWILKQPINIMGRILARVAERAIQIDDTELNGLMATLGLYEFKLPDGTHDHATQKKAMDAGIQAMAKRIAKEKRRKKA